MKSGGQGVRSTLTAPLASLPLCMLDCLLKILEGNKVKSAISHIFIFGWECDCPVLKLGVISFFEPAFMELMVYWNTKETQSNATGTCCDCEKERKNVQMRKLG
jgi:hypothetical protein